MRIKQSIVATISRPTLVLCLIGALAACVENPEDGEVELSDDLGAAERQAAASGDDIQPVVQQAAVATRSVVATNGSRSITCNITASDPWRFTSLVYGTSSVSCSDFVANIALTSYLNRGGFRWKSASASYQDIRMTLTANGGCSGTYIYRTEASYTITFPSGYWVVSGNRSSSFKSDNSPTISC